MVFSPSAEGQGFTLEAEDTRVEVVLRGAAHPPGVDPGLVLRQRAAPWRRSAGPRPSTASPSTTGSPQPTVPVFVALWCARIVLLHAEGVLVDITSSKLHEADDVAEITELDFDIRDHVNLHAVEVIEGDTPLWVHSHGMEKFGARDLEIFHLGRAGPACRPRPSCTSCARTWPSGRGRRCARRWAPARARPS